MSQRAGRKQSKMRQPDTGQRTPPCASRIQSVDQWTTAAADRVWPSFQAGYDNMAARDFLPVDLVHQVLQGAAHARVGALLGAADGQQGHRPHAFRRLQ